MTEHSQTLPVTVSEIPLANGMVAGHLTLNKPKALNALDLEMAEIMLGALKSWANRDEVAFILMDATGDKAFCAGGDIVSMYKAMKDNPDSVPHFVKTFFTIEYTLDYTIRTYNKPVIAWGHGIVMGGGMGLMTGASHRVVTDASRLAMPEISIGLYPDVGGTYFLPRLPGKTGLFLGLTGASINASDALYIGLADHYCQAGDKEAVLDALAQCDVTSAEAASQAVTEVLQRFDVSQDKRVAGQVEPHRQTIDTACDADSLITVVENIAELDASDDKWLSKAQKSLAAGSPITAHLVYEQINRGQSLSLAECFQTELGVSCHCGEYGEFQEGIRALLIDKDNSPKWKFDDVASVPADVVEYFFSDPWQGEAHPLAQLGEKS